MTILSVVFVNSGFTAYCIYMHNLDFHKLMDWQGYIVCTTAIKFRQFMHTYQPAWSKKQDKLPEKKNYLKRNILTNDQV